MNSILIDSLEMLGFQVWASRNARPLWPASFDHTVRLFKEANVGAEDLQALLNKIEVKSKNNSLAKIMCQSPGQAISASAKDFAKKLLVKDAFARLTAAQALCMFPKFHVM
jgi:hypothetical protein